MRRGIGTHGLSPAARRPNIAPLDAASPEERLLPQKRIVKRGDCDGSGTLSALDRGPLKVGAEPEPPWTLVQLPEKAWRGLAWKTRRPEWGGCLIGRMSTPGSEKTGAFRPAAGRFRPASRTK